MNRGVVITSMCLACSVVNAGSLWFREAGLWYRGGMEMELTAGSIDAVAAVGEFSSGSTVVAPTGQILGDNGTSQEFRTFDNGYVGPSGWGWARNDGVSQYWGYDHASQYDAGSDTLSFNLSVSDSGSADRQISRIVAGNRSWESTEQSGGWGGQVTVGRVMHQSSNWQWCGLVQLGWVQDVKWSAGHRFEDRLTIEQTTYRSSYERREDWTYVYDTLGNPAFPSAPYAMTDPAGTGPMISDRPASIRRDGDQQVRYSDRVVDRYQASVYSDLSISADAFMFVANLGPRVRFVPSDRWSLVLQAGITANMLDADVERRESFSLADGQVLHADARRFDDRKWLTGASASCGLEFQLSDAYYIQASGGYDYVEPYHFSLGPDRITLDLSGYSANIAFGLRFGGDQ